jgi:hypothetical protein
MSLKRLEASRKAVDIAFREGVGWDVLLPLIGQWFADFKAWEAKDTFTAAFNDSRMSARGVNTGSTARGGTFNVRNVQSGDNKKMTLASNAAGVKLRMNPKNLFDPDTLRRGKYDLGLHDLSASLLNPGRPIKEQLKFYETSYCMFFPLPHEEDLQLFHSLNASAKRDPGLGEEGRRQMVAWRSQITRVKRVQGSDMGATWADFSAPDAVKPKVRYGTRGTIIRTAGQHFGYPATQQELENRVTLALRYKSILPTMATKVNEIIVAFRHHANPDFPMFTFWKEGKQQFEVQNVGARVEATGFVVTNNGNYLHGRDFYFI